MSLQSTSAQQCRIVGPPQCKPSQRWSHAVQGQQQQQRPSNPYRTRQAQPLCARSGVQSASKAAERVAELGAAPAGQERRDSPPPPLPPSPPKPAGSPATGLVYLALVALLWGSYTPALRLAYSLPGPPTPVALTAASGVLELVVLLAALALTPAPPSPAEGGQQQQQQKEQEQQGGAAGAQQAQQAALPAAMLLGLPAAVLAGAEIGAYNSAASLSQIAGLSMTTAARGAFLIQASTLFTPILSSLAGSAPGRSVWLGSLLAFAGTLVITADHTGSSSGAELEAAASSAAAAAATAAAGLSLGDALTLVAALCYSAATVRIPVWAVRYGVPPVQLALGKAVALTAVAAVGLALQGAQLAGEGQPLSVLWPGWAQPQGWAILLWAALGPGALASVLHVKGQSLVSPSAAQIVFCSIPLWSAVLAAALLPDEPVGSGTWLGGAMVAAAGLVAAMGGARQPLGSSGTPAPDTKDQ